MCVYIYVGMYYVLFMYVQIHACMLVCMGYVSKHTGLCVSRYVCIHVFVCMYIIMYVCAYVCM